MSEDEATEKLKELVIRCKECKFATCENCEINWNEVQAIKTILDLYQQTKKSEEILANKFQKVNIELQQEKEKNKELSEELTEQMCNKVEVEVLEEYRLKLKNSISKDKIKAKNKIVRRKNSYSNT